MTPDETKYIVCDVDDLADWDEAGDEEKYTTREDAEIAAINQSYNDRVIAVYDVERDEVVSLVYQQVVFSV